MLRAVPEAYSTYFSILLHIHNSDVSLEWFYGITRTLTLFILHIDFSLYGKYTHMYQDSIS